MANYFTSGTRVGRVTGRVQIAEDIREINGEVYKFKLADCPGFGDRDNVFYDSYRTMRVELERMCPLNAILLVIKFVNTESIQFLEAANNFLRFFGSQAIKCLVIVCIQTGDIIYNDEQFRDILYNNEGYRCLFEENNNTHLHYCYGTIFGVTHANLTL